MPATDLITTHICPKATVEPTSTNAGLGVFATAPLEPGDIVLSVRRPLVVALDADRLRDTCYECFDRAGEEMNWLEGTLGFDTGAGGEEVKEVKLRACAGCKAVRYCSKECQKASWSAHHCLECPNFKVLYPHVMPNHFRAVLRLLLLRQAGKIREEDWDALLACPTHMKEYNQHAQKEELSYLANEAKRVFLRMKGAFDEGLITELLMRLRINSITLQSPFHDPLGFALHPILAKVNHNCQPNCYVRFLGPDSTKGVSGFNPGPIVLTPLRRIEVGEEIAIPYVDSTMPVRHRKQELEDRYFFTCDCAKCTTDERSDAQLVPEARRNMHKLQDQAKPVIDDTGKTSSKSPETRIELATAQIRHLYAHDTNWPVTLYPFPQLLNSLVQAHIDMQNWVSAFGLAALLHFQVNLTLYSSPIHPLYLTHLLMFIKTVRVLVDPVLGPTARTSADPQVLRLVGDLDLMVWCRALIEKFVTQTAETCKGEPWARWNAILLHRRLQSGRSSSLMDQISLREREKMDTLCKYVLNTWKNT